MKTHIIDIIKGVSISVLSTLALPLLTYFVSYLISVKFDFTVPPYIVWTIISISIFASIINLFRKNLLKKIDAIQEIDYGSMVIIPSDFKQIWKNDQVLYEVEFQKIQNGFHRPFENREPDVNVLYVDGPKCPECETYLKQTRKFWGKYKHFCPRGHVSFVNKYTNYTLSKHKQVDIEKSVREKGAAEFIKN
ncbi:hypothetical protein [Enterococcus sp. AZ136]|uniref:hypothetical protein n=1 Tax=Enterococcus sp. AZ136 TaxID=2774788 RepID=UPI003D2AB183